MTSARGHRASRSTRSKGCFVRTVLVLSYLHCYRCTSNMRYSTYPQQPAHSRQSTEGAGWHRRGAQATDIGPDATRSYRSPLIGRDNVEVSCSTTSRLGCTDGQGQRMLTGCGHTGNGPSTGFTRHGEQEWASSCFGRHPTIRQVGPSPRPMSFPTSRAHHSQPRLR